MLRTLAAGDSGLRPAFIPEPVRPERQRRNVSMMKVATLLLLPFTTGCVSYIQAPAFMFRTEVPALMEQTSSAPTHTSIAYCLFA